MLANPAAKGLAALPDFLIYFPSAIIISQRKDQAAVTLRDNGLIDWLGADYHMNSGHAPSIFIFPPKIPMRILAHARPLRAAGGGAIPRIEDRESPQPCSGSRSSIRRPGCA